MNKFKFTSLTRFHEEGEKNFLFREVRENTPLNTYVRNYFNRIKIVSLEFHWYGVIVLK